MQFRVDQRDYQGPLDLLASLSIDRDLPLDSISLAEIARRYREGLGRGDLSLAEVGDFALLEARLIRLKAAWQRLLPDVPEEDGEAAAEPVRDAGALAVLRFLQSRRRQAEYLHPAARMLANYPPEALIQALERIDRRAVQRIGRRVRLRAAPRVQFRRVLLWLRQALRSGQRVEVAAPLRSRGERVLELLAALELTRLGEAEIEQSRLYAPIFITRRGADIG